MSNNKYTEDMTGTGQYINYPTMIKHICVKCETVQYIPIRLLSAIVKMYCYVCGKKIDGYTQRKSR